MAWQGGAVPGGRGERVGGARAHCQGSHAPVVYLTCLVSGAMGWFPARPPSRALPPAGLLDTTWDQGRSQLSHHRRLLSSDSHLVAWGLGCV